MPYKSCKIGSESLGLLPCWRENKKYHISARFRPRISLELLNLNITPEFVLFHVKNRILNRALKPSSSYFFLFFFLFAHYKLKTPSNGSKLLISRVN